MEVATLIPQLFFDLIGRVAPGLYLLSITFVAIAPKSVAQKNIDTLLFQAHSPTTLLTLTFLGVSYLIGTAIGSLGYTLFGCEFKRWFSDHATPPAKSKEYKYDYLQVKDPPSGLRLAKLSAERHACWVVLCGTPVVLFARWLHGSPATPLIPNNLFYFILAIGMITAWCFWLHLRIRFVEALGVFYQIAQAQHQGPPADRDANDK